MDLSKSFGRRDAKTTVEASVRPAEAGGDGIVAKEDGDTNPGRAGPVPSELSVAEEKVRVADDEKAAWER